VGEPPIWLRIIMITGRYSPRAGNGVGERRSGWKVKFFRSPVHVRAALASLPFSRFIIYAGEGRKGSAGRRRARGQDSRGIESFGTRR